MRRRARRGRARARRRGARGRPRPSLPSRSRRRRGVARRSRPRAGRPAAVSSTWVESEQLTPRIFVAWTRWARAISLSSARTSAPPRTTSSPPTTRRSTRCGPERTSPATRSSAPPSSSPSVRQIARSACFPGSSEPMSSRREHVGAAAGREAERLARGHRLARRSRPRATRRACFTSRKRSLRSFDAEPSTPRPTRTPASTSCRTGATPAPSRRFDVGQWATPVPVSREARDRSPGEMDAVRAPEVVAEPSEPVEILDGRAAV